MKKLIAFAFKICLVLFLVSGTCLVLGQLTGILFQNGNLVIKTWDWFSTPTFMISAIAGILGYILGYFPKDKAEAEVVVEHSSNEKNINSRNEVSKEVEHVH